MALLRPQAGGHPTDRLVGTSPALEVLRAQIRHLARFDTLGKSMVPTLLLQGETGTGKGVTARVIHDSGPRAAGPFIEVNCAAIPDTMLEAELFGFVAGAFTDAKHTKPGLFEAASGGTLVLDEIDALSLPLQSKLLTALETKRIRRLGAVREQGVDVKLIVTSNVELSQSVASGRFRADLYHRLAVLVLGLPPLRARGEDVVVLAQTLLQQYAAAHNVPPKRLSATALAWLRSYDWPGNVRELNHLIERATLLHPGADLDAEALAQLCLPRGVTAAPAYPQEATPPPTERVLPKEGQQVLQALHQAQWNVVQAGHLLGMNRDAVRYRMRRYGITRPARALPAPPAATPTPNYHTPTVPAAAASVEAARAAVALEGSASASPRPEPYAPGSRATAGEESPLRGVGWEQKPVAVLALDVTWPEATGSAAVSCEPWTEAARWEHLVVDQVQEYGGVVLPHTGTPLLCVFGVPRTLEQQLQRAIHAALALRQLASAEAARHKTTPQLTLRLAVHVGTVWVDSQAPEPSARVFAVGETFGLPVRLLGPAAPEEIVVSAEAGRLVEARMELEKREFWLGGRCPKPTTGYAVLGVRQGGSPLARRSGRTLSQFVGRRRELATLRELLRATLTGHGQVVGLVGEPGVGKSRLLSEFCQRVAGEHVQYIEGRCLSYGSATPYLPMLDLLHALCGITVAESPQTITTHVHGALQAVGMESDTWAAYLLHLLGLAAGAEPLAGGSPDVLKSRMFEALSQMICRSSQQQPLLVAVEDVQWIDRTSEEFLTRLVEHLGGTPILLLLTYRPGYRAPWVEKSYVTQMALRPLAAPESLRVLQSIAPANVSPALAQMIHARAQGNPLFLEEIMQTLRDQGVLGEPPALALTDQSSHLLQAVSDLRLPATVQEVLAARMDCLEPVVKRLLQTAAVIGTEVPLSLLQVIAVLPAETLHTGLAQLRATEFLYETRGCPEPVYTFKHVLTQDVAYSSLPPALRRLLHATIVTAIEQLAPAQRAAVASGAKGLPAGRPAPDQVERLAHHALRGEVWDRAVTYCQQAGARASDRAAFHEAVAYFEQALQALTHLPESSDTRVLAIELRLVAGVPLTILGENGRRLALLGEAEILARALGDRARLAWVLTGRAQVLRMTGDHHSAMAPGWQALELAAALGDSALQMRASHNLGQAYYAIGDFGQAAELLLRSVEAADRESDTPSAGLRILSRAWLARTLSALGAFADGRCYGEEALRLATLDGRGPAPIIVCGCLGYLYLAQGDLEHAIRVFDQGLVLCRASGSRNWRQSIVAGLGYAYTLQGRLAEGRTLLEEAISNSLRTGAQQRPHRVAWLSEVCRLAGHCDEAWQHACQALDLARQQKDRAEEALALHQLGTVQAHAAPPTAKQAEAYYQQALALADELGMRPFVAHCHHGLGRLYCQMGRRVPAGAALSAAIELYRAMDMAFWLPQAEAALAQMA